MISPAMTWEEIPASLSKNVRLLGADARWPRLLSLIPRAATAVGQILPIHSKIVPTLKVHFFHNEAADNERGQA